MLMKASEIRVFVGKATWAKRFSCDVGLTGRKVPQPLATKLAVDERDALA